MTRFVPLWLPRTGAILAFLLAGAGPAAAEHAFRLETLKAHYALVRCVKYAPDGGRFLSAGFDGRVRLFDAATFAPTDEMRVDGVQFYWCDFLPDANSAAVGGSDGAIRIWNFDSGEVTPLADRHASAVWTGAVAREQQTLVSGSPSTELWTWNLPAKAIRRKASHPAEIWWLAVAPDEQQIAVAGGDGAIGLYRLDDGSRTATLTGHERGVYAVDYAPQGARLASGGWDHTLRIWDLARNEALFSLPHFSEVLSVSFSPDGAVVATGSNDYIVRLWDARSGQFLEKLTGPRDAVWCLDYAPDGESLLAACADGNVYRWTGLAREESPPVQLPAAVDLRKQFSRYKLRIIGQHARGSCSVHTFTRALEFAASRGTNKPVRLSDEYLNWASNQLLGNVGPEAVDRGQFFEHLWMASLRLGVCPADEMPFTLSFDPQLAPSPAAGRQAAEWDRSRFVWHDLSGPGIASDEVVRRAKSVLADGWPVLAGSTHSLLIVGYRDDAQLPGGGYFLVADSGAAGGNGDFIVTPNSDPLHSAITYARVDQYGCSWIEYVDDDSE